jgi:hypothetical protein
MENHQFQWVDPLFPWPFSISELLVYQKVNIPKDLPTKAPRLQVLPQSSSLPKKWHQRPTCVVHYGVFGHPQISHGMQRGHATWPVGNLPGPKQHVEGDRAGAQLSGPWIS